MTDSNKRTIVVMGLASLLASDKAILIGKLHREMGDDITILDAQQASEMGIMVPPDCETVNILRSITPFTDNLYQDIPRKSNKVIRDEKQQNKLRAKHFRK